MRFPASLKKIHRIVFKSSWWDQVSETTLFFAFIVWCCFDLGKLRLKMQSFCNHQFFAYLMHLQGLKKILLTKSVRFGGDRWSSTKAICISHPVNTNIYPTSYIVICRLCKGPEGATLAC